MTKPKTREEVLAEFEKLKASSINVEGSVLDSRSRSDAFVKEFGEKLVSAESGISAPPGPIAGRHYIYIVRNPRSWKGQTDNANDYASTFEGSEWLAVFRDVLKCPVMPLEDAQQSSDELADAFRHSFQASIPQYGLLARMWDTYADVLYENDELPQLMEECLRIKELAENDEAVSGLKKLIKACEQALKDGRGLFLAAD